MMSNCCTNNSIIETVTADTFVYVYSSVNSWQLRASMVTLQDYMQANLTFGVSSATTQYDAPSSTGFSVQINNDANDTHLILTPTATFATGTIVLPTSSVAVDKQQLQVNCTQIVTALTVDGNGATVTGEPVSLAVNDFFTLKYDKATSVWYRVS
jgi:hypothetical protein